MMLNLNGSEYEVIWKFRTRQFVVEYAIIPDHDLDLSFDEDGTVQTDLDHGRLIAFVARVRVLWQGRELGSDYLSSCIYKSPEEFMDHKGRNVSGHGSYFTDMIRAAISEARETAAQFRSIPLRLEA